MINENIARGYKKCALCETSFEWAGIFRGENNLSNLAQVLKVNQLADIVVLKRSAYNHGKALGADLEVIATCPNCNARNKFTAVHVLHREEY